MENKSSPKWAYSVGLIELLKERYDDSLAYLITGLSQLELDQDLSSQAYLRK